MTQDAFARWLDARAVIARDLFRMGKIYSSELRRVIADAETGFYSGPLTYKDGTESKDQEAWQRITSPAKPKAKRKIKTVMV